jgi:hypothetical protein
VCKAVSETSAAMGVTNVSVCPHQGISIQSPSQFTVNLVFHASTLGLLDDVGYMAQNDRVAKVVQSFTLLKTYIISKALILIMYKNIQYSV